MHATLILALAATSQFFPADESRYPNLKRNQQQPAETITVPGTLVDQHGDPLAGHSIIAGLSLRTEDPSSKDGAFLLTGVASRGKPNYFVLLPDGSSIPARRRETNPLLLSVSLDHHLIQGLWREVAPPDADEPKRHVTRNYAITADRLTIAFGRSYAATFRYRLDATASPPHIDLTREPGGGKTRPGIYRLDGDELRLALGSGADRPTSFDQQPAIDTSQTIYLRRADPLAAVLRVPDIEHPDNLSVRDALISWTNVDCLRFPLADTLRYFAGVHRIDIQIDPSVPKPENMTVTLRATRLSLHDALHMALTPLGLDYHVTAGTIHVVPRTND